MSYKEKEEKISSEDIDALRFALNNQIGWQKYAEGKLLLLTTISAGSLALLFEFIVNLNDIDDWVFKIVLIIFGLTSFISFAVGIVTIAMNFRQYENKEVKKYSKMIGWDTVIKKKNIKELIEVSKNYDKKDQIKDIMVEHYYGSFHTYKKYKAFNAGIKIYGIGLTIIFLYTIFNIIITNSA